MSIQEMIDKGVELEDLNIDNVRIELVNLDTYEITYDNVLVEDDLDYLGVIDWINVNIEPVFI